MFQWRRNAILDRVLFFSPRSRYAEPSPLANDEKGQFEMHVNGEFEMELTVLYQRSAGNSEMATGWWTYGNEDVLIARPFSKIWS